MPDSTCVMKRTVVLDVVGYVCSTCSNFDHVTDRDSFNFCSICGSKIVKFEEENE